MSGNNDELANLSNDITSQSYFPKDSDITGVIAPQPARRAFPGSESIVILLEFAGSISAGLIANWLYDRLKGKGATIYIGRNEVKIENAEKLKELIIETTTEENDKKPGYSSKMAIEANNQVNKDVSF